jgi:hypothetical protein
MSLASSATSSKASRNSLVVVAGGGSLPSWVIVGAGAINGVVPVRKYGNIIFLHKVVILIIVVVFLGSYKLAGKTHEAIPASIGIMVATYLQKE